LPITWEQVSRLAADLPGVTAGKSYGTPAFFVGKKLFARLHQDGLSVVLNAGFDERDHLLTMAPEMYCITDHYRDYPKILARLSTGDVEQFRTALRRSWAEVAPKRLRATDPPPQAGEDSSLRK
jgi:hypothetical protein